MEPVIRREGNLRFVSLPLEGWPFDYEDAIQPVDEVLASGTEQGIRGYGPAQIMVSLPPDDPDPQTWSMHLGRACTGIPAVRSPLLVEDYQQLVTVTIPHHGPVRDLARSFRLAADFARSQGARPRPYWRISLHRRATPDGQGILVTEVAVFIDR